MTKHMILLHGTIFVVVLLITAPSSGEVIVEPRGFGAAVGQGEERIIEMTLLNESERTVHFEFSYDRPPDDDERERRGPRRDDAGDLLGQVDAGINQIGGMCSDGELVFGCSYGSSRVVAMTVEEEPEQALNFGCINRPLAITFTGEELWIVGWDGNQAASYDLEGNQIDQFQMPFRQITGMGSDRDEFVFCRSRQDGQIHVLTIDDREQVATFDPRQAFNNADVWGIDWVPDHREGQLWGNARGQVYQAFVDEDWNVEAVQSFEWRSDQPYVGPAHDGENLWHGSWNNNTWYWYDDGTPEAPQWLTIEPGEGELQPDDLFDLEAVFNAAEVEFGIYEVYVILELEELDEMRDDLEETTILMSAVMTVGGEAGFVSGTVTDAATDEPIEGATIVLDQYHMTRTSHQRGDFEFSFLPLGEYSISVTQGDYLPTTVEFEVEGEDEIELNVEMLHSECNPDPEEIAVEIAQDERTTEELTVTNDGNGPLSYRVERRLVGEADVEPWVMRRNLEVGNAVDDSRLEGVVYVDGRYYVSGTNDRDPVIYIFNTDGDSIGSFEQPGNDDRGMRDLAWDGELLWGVSDDDVIGFTLEGEVVQQFDAPVRPIQAIAWDSHREMIWLCAITTDIFLMSPDGELEGEIDRHDLRIYGLAFWKDDPDNCPLYVFHRIGGNDYQTVHKFNPDLEDPDPVFVTDLYPEAGGTPGGAFITNQLDVYSWVFLAISDNSPNDGGDRVDVWQLEARKDWFGIEPTEGVIDAEAEQVFEVEFDATDWPAVQLEGELYFTHDGLGGETIVPVTLDIEEGEGGGEEPVERVIQLREGWNMISLNIDPLERDVVELTRPLVDEEALILLKDGAGRFYSPEFEFNNIPRWNVDEGYQMKVTRDIEWTVEGMPIPRDEPIQLIEGWQMISYYPRVPVEATVAFAGIENRLVIAKDGEGRFYSTEFEFSNMGDLVEGQGYQVKMSEDAELVWNVPDRDRLSALSSQGSALGGRRSDCRVEGTGRNMSLLVLADDLTEGAAVEVYAGGRLVGAGEVIDGAAGVAVWGDDLTTDVVDGALDDERLRVAFRDGDAVSDLAYSDVTGDARYTTDGLWVIEAEGVAGVPTEFGIITAYPNPFNSTLRLTYGLPEAGEVRLAVYDLTGREAGILASGRRESGVHVITFDGNGLSSGVYFVELEALGRTERWKVALLR